MLLHLVGPAKHPQLLSADSFGRLLDAIPTTPKEKITLEQVEVYAINAEHQDCKSHSRQNASEDATNSMSVAKGSRGIGAIAASSQLHSTNGTMMSVSMDGKDGRGKSISEEYCVSAHLMTNDAYLGWPIPLPKMLVGFTQMLKRSLSGRKTLLRLLQ